MIFAILRMALRQIGRNVMRSLLTTLGIVIGVAAVIAMVTLGRGASGKVQSDVAAMGTNLLIVMPGADRRGPASSAASAFQVSDVHAIEREIRTLSGVAPTSSKGVLVVAGNRNWSTTVTGTTDAFMDVRAYKIERGASFSDGDLATGTAVCVLGATVRRELFAAQDPIGEAVRVGSVACKVIGVLAPKGQAAMGQDQDDILLMPLRTVQRRITGSKDITAIFVSARRAEDTERAKAQLGQLLRERRHVPSGHPDDFNVTDVKEIANTLTAVTKTLTVLLAGIACVSLLVGGVGIMNIMLVAVTERTREIGLRMAIGALPSEVLTQFLLEAVTLAVIGGTLGVAVGLGLSLGVCRIFELPFEAGADVVSVGFGFSAIVGVVFGLLPARKAARMTPIDALRHE